MGTKLNRPFASTDSAHRLRCLFAALIAAVVVIVTGGVFLFLAG